MKKLITILRTMLLVMTMTQMVEASDRMYDVYGPVLEYETEYREIDITNPIERDMENDIVQQALEGDPGAHGFSARIRECIYPSHVWKDIELNYTKSDGSRGWLIASRTMNWSYLEW